jgi:hypothetical protein
VGVDGRADSRQSAVGDRRSWIRSGALVGRHRERQGSCSPAQAVQRHDDEAEDEGKSLRVELDRLGCDAPDVLATIKTLANLGGEVVMLQLGKLDPTSPAGKLMFAMLAAVAKPERDLIGGRTEVGLARAKAEGKPLGKPLKATPAQC